MELLTKFRKRPIVIEAIQLTKENMDKVAKLCDGSVGYTTIFLTTLEGVMSAQFGDWIIKGVKGEFYPCKPDIFDATYEPVKSLEGEKEQVCESTVFEQDYQTWNGDWESAYRCRTGCGVQQKISSDTCHDCGKRIKYAESEGE